MVLAHYVDLQGHAGEVIFKGLRCTNCGEFIDQMVLANRMKLMPQSLDGPKKKEVCTTDESQEICYRQIR